MSSLFLSQAIEDQDRLHREQTQLKEDHLFDTVGSTLFGTIMEVCVLILNALITCLCVCVCVCD